MVRRLVEQENVGVLQNEARQVDARFLAAGERVEKLIAHGGRDVKTVGDLAAAHLGIVPAEHFKAREKLVVFREQRAVA